ncbi:TIGR03862 family flavoprotein [Chitinimonas sp.]|uniref:TIGR03862 family flavoprotein n=1 Tax=Chitinimonas sp. TaxID=1934313 RepID=UPI0035B0EEAB
MTATPTPPPAAPKSIAIIGGGPAGLMAAEVISAAGYKVDVYDAMPSVGRKFLLAGVGGMNITHSEGLDAFIGRYAPRQQEVGRLLADFTPDDLRAWVHGLGIDTFVGSSGRVFPTDMKAAPLLRAWLHRLRAAGVALHVRHRWLGWTDDGALRIASPAGELAIRPAATVLALGGASWQRLGSDGAWVPLLAAQGIDIAPLAPANCGFDVAWSEPFRSKHAGQPLKSIALTFTDVDGHTERKLGECVVSQHGVEGSLIYAFSRRIRDSIAAHGHATLWLDLAPGKEAERVLAEVSHPRGSRSLSSHLQSRAGITGVKAGLLRECLPRDAYQDPARLAQGIKALPVRVCAARPIDEAISSAGGVCFSALNAQQMLQALPGVFCAGEMLDWEAPTGGYLLSACFASGRMAGHGVLDWLSRR